MEAVELETPLSLSQLRLLAAKLEFWRRSGEILVTTGLEARGDDEWVAKQPAGAAGTKVVSLA